ncbi:MAG: hypothetical protein OXC60_10335 [Litoreibacter sp.]|nr:hypothetical protein [Litoreibacter sp.]
MTIEFYNTRSQNQPAVCELTNQEVNQLNIMLSEHGMPFELNPYGTTKLTSYHLEKMARIVETDSALSKKIEKLKDLEVVYAEGE